MGWPSFVAVTAPPLLLAGLGLTHPNDLTGASAGWWTSLHIILVPLFPQIGVSHWVLLHGRLSLGWTLSSASLAISPEASAMVLMEIGLQLRA